MCNPSCKACKCGHVIIAPPSASQLLVDEFAKLIADGFDPDVAFRIAAQEEIEVELDMGAEDFLETLEWYEYERE